MSTQSTPALASSSTSAQPSRAPTPTGPAHAHAHPSIHILIPHTHTHARAPAPTPLTTPGHSHTNTAPLTTPGHSHPNTNPAALFRAEDDTPGHSHSNFALVDARTPTTPARRSARAARPSSLFSTAPAGEEDAEGEDAELASAHSLFGLSHRVLGTHVEDAEDGHHSGSPEPGL